MYRKRRGSQQVLEEDERESRYGQVCRYSGPAGLIEQDDIENWNYASAASKGVTARCYSYNCQLGMGFEHPYEMLPGVVNEGITKQNQRSFYKRWAEFMMVRS
jgi:hypothetical protein